MGFGEVKQLHIGSRRDDKYEKVNEETPVMKASMCHLSQEENPHFSFCWNATFSDNSVTEMCWMEGTF